MILLLIMCNFLSLNILCIFQAYREARGLPVMLKKFDVCTNLSIIFWNNLRSIIYVLALFYIAAPDIGEASYSKYKLKQEYDFHCQQISDIYEHIPLLRNLSMDCSSAIEIGVKNVVSTWGILQ